jgi:hypothetical protein
MSDPPSHLYIEASSMEAPMSDYTEFTALSGLLALAGILIMANLRVELWCERWLERLLIQPLSSEPTNRIQKQADEVH